MTSKPRVAGSIWTLGLVALAAAGVAVTLLATRSGVGLSPDSTGYLRAAESLLDGDGLLVLRPCDYPEPVPMVHWPPLLPVVLASGTLLSGADLETVARWLNAGLLGASLCLFALIVARQTGSRFAGAATGSILLTSVGLLRAHQVASSEPLYLFLGFLGLFGLERYLALGRRRVLVGSALCIGLAWLDRYIGVALVGTALLTLAFARSLSPRRRLADALLFGGVSCAPMLAWLVRWFRLLPAEGVEGFSPITPDWQRLGSDLGSMMIRVLWVAPTDLAVFGPHADRWRIALAILGAGGLATAWWIARSRAPRPAHRPYRWTAILALSAVLHAGVLVATVWFVFPRMRYSTRLLLPAALAVLLVGIDLAWRCARRSVPSRLASSSLALLCAVLVATGGAGAVAEIRQAFRQGLELNGLGWKRSPMVAFIGTLDPDVPIYTNHAEALFVHARPDARFIPCKVLIDRQTPNPRWESQIADLRRRLASDGGIVLYFTWRNALARIFPSPEELQQRLDLRVIARVRGGIAFAPAAGGGWRGASGAASDHAGAQADLDPAPAIRAVPE